MVSWNPFPWYAYLLLPNLLFLPSEKYHPLASWYWPSKQMRVREKKTSSATSSMSKLSSRSTRPGEETWTSTWPPPWAPSPFCWAGVQETTTPRWALTSGLSWPPTPGGRMPEGPGPWSWGLWAVRHRRGCWRNGPWCYTAPRVPHTSIRWWGITSLSWPCPRSKSWRRSWTKPWRGVCRVSCGRTRAMLPSPPPLLPVSASVLAPQFWRPPATQQFLLPPHKQPQPGLQLCPLSMIIFTTMEATVFNSVAQI